MMKRILSMVLCITMLLTMMPAQALAAELTGEAEIIPVTETTEPAIPETEPAAPQTEATEATVAETETQEALSASEGTLGDAMSWVLDDAGTLTISGTGAMPDYSYREPAPWKSLSSQITKVVIEEGVTRVGVYAFNECRSILEVSIPSTVTAIGSNAFNNCNALTALVLPEGLTSIGESAFSYCNALKTVTIPGSVTDMAQRAFYYCQGLQSAVIGEGITSLPQYLFYGCGKLTEVTLPSTLTQIGNGVFNGANLSAVALPEGLTSIGNDAFSGNRNLTAVTLPAGLTYLGDSAFNSCSKLTEIVIPEGITEIGDTTFNYCTRLSSVAFLGDVTRIGKQAFQNCTNLENINIPDTVTVIDEGAFSHSSSLGSITLPDGLVTIGASAFATCYMTGALVIPDSVTSIGEHAFEWNRHTSVKLGAGITQIPAYCFNYGSLESIEIPEGITSIGEQAFYSCSLKEVTIPSTVTTIGAEAFSDCGKLAAIHVAEGNTNYASLDGVLFTADMTQLLQYPASKETAVYAIPDTVTSIGDSTFYNCRNLTEVTVPGSVQSIGEHAFESCTALAKITLGEGIREIKYNAFASTAITALTLPDSVTTLGYGVFSNCEDLEKAHIGAGLQTMEGGVFSDCHKLAGITVSDANAYFTSDDGVMLNKDRTALVQFPGGKTAYVIPDTVTELPSYGFSGNENLISITIPGSVKTLDESVFSSCTALTELTLCEGIEAIGSRCFYSCTALAEVTIPASVKTIGTGAFAGCSALKKIHFLGDAPSISNDAFGFEFSETSKVAATAYYPGDNATWTEDKRQNYGGNLVWMVEGTVELVDMGTCGDNLTWTLDVENTLTVTGSGAMAASNAPAAVPWHDYRDTITKVVLDDGITALADYAFRDMVNLTAMDLPDELTGISVEAFYGCFGLTSVAIPDGVTAIGDRAFYGCNKLASVTFGEGLQNVGANAFYGTPWLEQQTDENGFTVIGGVLVQYLGDETEVVVPNTVRVIGTEAFSAKRSYITSVTLPDTVTSIQTKAFYRLNKLVSVNMPAGVTTIGAEAFRECYKLTEIAIPEGVTELGAQAFRACENLTKVQLPGTLKVIGERAFQSCVSLAEIALPEGLTEIGDNAFSACRVLTALTLPEGLTTIGEGAFSSCEALTEVAIPDSVTAMGEDAFDNCVNLAKLTIGSGLRELAYGVFMRCSSLTEVTIPINIYKIGAAAFRHCTALEKINFAAAASTYSVKGGVEDDWEDPIVIPDIGTALEIYEYAFGNCQGLTKVELPDHLTYLHQTAFQDSRNTTFYQVNSKKYQNDEVGAVYEMFNGTRINLICVPAKLSGVYHIADTVTGVKANFYGCSELTELYFPTSVGGISGSYCFYGCSKLIKVVAGPDNDDGYYNDEFGALLYTSGGRTYVCFLPANLTEYTVAANVYSIYSSALSNVKLQSIQVDPENAYYSGQDGLLYSKDCTKLILYPGGKTGETYFLPMNLEEIQENAFANAEHLKQIWFTGEPVYFGAGVFGSAAETLESRDMVCRYPENIGYWPEFIMEMAYAMGDIVTWEPYTLVQTNGEALTVNAGDTVAVRAEADISGLKAVLVDGKTQAEETYSVIPNGNMVLLGEQINELLAQGDHTVELKFADGSETIGTMDNLLSQEEFEEELDKAWEEGRPFTLTSAVAIEEDLEIQARLQILSDGCLIVRNGATLKIRSYLYVEGGTIRVENGGTLHMNYNEIVDNARLEVEAGGLLVQKVDSLSLEGGSELHNRGTIQIEENAYLWNMSTVINDGTILVRGTLRNNRNLTNNGEIAVAPEGVFEDFGTFTGNPVTEWTGPEYQVVITGPSSVLSGKSILLKAEITPENATGTKILWRLENEADKAYVSLHNGRVTAKKVTQVRTVAVLAEAEDGSAESARTVITVIPLATSVAIAWENDLDAGEDSVITYDVNNTRAGSLILRAVVQPEGASEDVEWTWSDSKGAYADFVENQDGSLTVEATGKTGTVTVTAATSDGSDLSAKVKIQFVKLAQEIEITNLKERIRGGDKLSLSTTVAEDKTLSKRNVTWALIDDGETTSSAFATLSKGKLTTRQVSVPTLVKVMASVTENPAIYDVAEIWLHPAVDTVAILLSGEQMANNATVSADPADGDLFLDALFGPDDVIEEGTWTVSDKKGTYATFREDAAGGLTLTPTGKAGTVTVTLKAADGSNKSAKLKVKFQTLVDDFTLNAEKTTLRTGEKLQLTASGAGKFTWTSDNTAVATVSSSGKVTAKTVYENTKVTITATAKDGSGKQASLELTVCPKLDKTLGILCDGANVTAKTITVDIDRVQALTVEAGMYDTNENAYADASDAVITSSNKKVADFENGKLVIAGTGKTNVTAKLDRKTMKFTLNVARFADTLEITGKTDWLLAGKNQTLKAVLTSAAGKITDKTVVWSSGDPAVATVNNKGKVTAQKIYTRQTVTITASTANGKVIDTFELTVYPAATTVSVVNGNGEVMNNRTITAKVGQTLDLTAIVYPFDGADTGAMQDVTWSISNKKAAAFNEEGELELLKTGNVTVKVTTLDGSRKTVSFKLKIVNP